MMAVSNFYLFIFGRGFENMLSIAVSWVVAAFPCFIYFSGYVTFVIVAVMLVNMNACTLQL